MKYNPMDILLVEDNHADARLLLENLKEAAPGSFEVTRVISLEDAFEELKQKPYHVMLLDLSLPDSEGLDTVDTVLKEVSKVAVVVLTGIDDEALGGEAVRKGAQDYFVKGQTDWRLLVRGIRYAAERRRFTDELEELNQTLEQRVAERTALAEQRAAQLQALAIELTQTEERERREIAHIIHDELQQLLVAARFSLAGLSSATGKDEEVCKSAAHVDALLETCIKASRSLTQELSPPVLYDQGLVPALNWLAGWMKDKHGLNVQIESTTQDDCADENTRVFMFRAVRELLFNIVKHAKADCAHVHVDCGASDNLAIVVSDNGIGFNTDILNQSTTQYKGFGLFSIHERLNMLGGHITIASQPDQGTTISITIPLSTTPPESM